MALAAILLSLLIVIVGRFVSISRPIIFLSVHFIGVAVAGLVLVGIIFPNDIAAILLALAAILLSLLIVIVGRFVRRPIVVAAILLVLGSRIVRHDLFGVELLPEHLLELSFIDYLNALLVNRSSLRFARGVALIIVLVS